MAQAVLSPDLSFNTVAWREAYVQAFRRMNLARTLDEKMASLYRAGKIFGGVYLGRGQEAVSVAIGQSLRPGDVFAPLIRDGAGRIAFGESIYDAVRTYLGSPQGPMRSRDGNVHRGRPKQGLLPMLSHLGAMISVVNGTLMARRFRGETEVVGATCLGDGATSTGAFHEGLNQAAVEKLPLILVVADNQYAYSTPTSRQFACADLVDRAAGYGVEGHSVDGTSLQDCLKVMGEAVRRARVGLGPQLIVAKLLRLCGHGEHDDSGYIDPKLKQSAIGRDCLKLAEAEILKLQWANAAEIEAWKKEAHVEVDRVVSEVQREAGPDVGAENWQALASKHLLETHPE